MTKLALYFGYGTGGHFLYDMDRLQSTLDPQHVYGGFPWEGHHLDSGLLQNSREPEPPTGRVRWTCGGRPHADVTDPGLWFAFFWWDRSGDSRPKSNSGFYVRGFEIGESEEAFAYACSIWTEVVERQHFQLILVKQ